MFNTTKWHTVELALYKWVPRTGTGNTHLVNHFEEEHREKLEWIRKNIPFHKIEIIEVYRRGKPCSQFVLRVLHEDDLTILKLATNV